MRVRAFALAGLMMLVTWSPGVLARWTQTLPPVSKDDVAMMKAAAREGMDDKPVGATNTWSNPETKNSGEVTLLRRFEEDGRECRILRHVVNVANYSPWERRTKICRDAAGQWEVRPLSAPEDE